MLRRLFISLLLTLGLTTTGFCSDIIYSLTGHEFMPVQKGNLHVELSSTTANIDNSTNGELEIQTVSLYSAFDVSDKLSINIDLPYVNSKQTSWDGESTRASGLGDVSAGIKYQVLDQKESFSDLYFHFTTLFPTGDSPYEDRDKPPTGSGGYSLKPEIAIAKKISNSVPFCSFFYQYNFKIDDLSYHQYETDAESGVSLKEVEPGDEYGISLGFVKLMRNNLSLLLRYDYHKSTTSKYNWDGRDDYEMDSMDFSKIATGMGLKFTSGLALFSIFSIGTGDDAPDYEVEISISF